MFDMTKPIDRLYFGKEFNDVMKMPNLIDIQLSSFERFLQREHLRAGKLVQKQGIEEVFQSIFPIESPNGDLVLEYCGYTLDETILKLF